jgi:hypothetical protein
MFAFANVLDVFSHELSGLRGRSFPFAFVFLCAVRRVLIPKIRTYKA